MNQENKFKPEKPILKDVLAEKERAIIGAKKPAYIYQTIDELEETKKQDDPIYENDYEKLQRFAMNTLLERIEQAPKAQNWSQEMKDTVNTHIDRLKEINNNKISQLEDEYLEAQKLGQNFKFKELEKKLDECRLFGAKITEIYKNINQIKIKNAA